MGIKKNILLVSAVVILITFILIGFILYNKNLPAKIEDQPDKMVNVSPSPQPSVEQFDFVDKGAGRITGKLCYPSEVIPAGVIEAKRVEDGKLVTQKYLGSNEASSSAYSFELNTGNYNIRFKTDDKIGYHSTVCPLGVENTCGNKNHRVLLSAKVEKGKTIENYNLCDFYFTDKNSPIF